MNKKQFKKLKKEIKRGHDWFNACQKVDDYLMEELGANRFITIHDTPYENTIASIKLLIEETRDE